MFRHFREKQRERKDHGRSYDAVENVTQHLAQVMIAAAVRDQYLGEQSDDYYNEQPARSTRL